MNFKKKLKFIKSGFSIYAANDHALSISVINHPEFPSHIVHMSHAAILVWLLPVSSPVNVKHEARCVMGKVGGETKTQTGGNFNLFIYFNLLLKIRGNRLIAFDNNYWMLVK